MTQNITLTTDSVIMPSYGDKPESLVILLHGLGSNGDDLIGLASQWREALPNTAFISPNAPFPCDMAPSGFQWFSMQSLDPQDLLAGIKETSPILNRFIDEQLKHFDIPDKHMALVGFSQGTMMSLYTAPRREKACAGILGYSGALFEDKTVPVKSKPAICLIHGDADQVVPVGASKMSHDILINNGFKSELHIRPDLTHSIDQEGVNIGRNFLTAILN